MKNCLTCQHCGEWGEDDGYGNLWSDCKFPLNLPTCVIDYKRARLINMQRESLSIGFCEGKNSPIGYICNCPAHEPKGGAV